MGNWVHPRSEKKRRLAASPGLLRYLYLRANSHILLGMSFACPDEPIADLVKRYREITGDERSQSYLYGELNEVRRYFYVAEKEVKTDNQ